MRYQDIQQFTPRPSYAVDVSLDYLADMLARYLDTHKLDMDPDFQRGHVWHEYQQTRFVEYLLKGGHAARIILFNQPGWMTTCKGDFVLVDGKQRLEACLKFLRGKLPVFDGNFRCDFEDKLPMMVGLRFEINTLKTRAELLQWYLDLNTGGVVHSDTAIRKVRDLLRDEKSS